MKNYLFYFNCCWSGHHCCHYLYCWHYWSLPLWCHRHHYSPHPHSQTTDFSYCQWAHETYVSPNPRCSDINWSDCSISRWNISKLFAILENPEFLNWRRKYQMFIRLLWTYILEKYEYFWNVSTDNTYESWLEDLLFKVPILSIGYIVFHCRFESLCINKLFQRSWVILHTYHSCWQQKLLVFDMNKRENRPLVY